MKPTDEQFTSYQELYDYFNKGLFNGKLPPIILNFSRKANSCGFFAADRWKKEKNKTHEISINPTYLSHAPFCDVCQTLAHEMCHLWQFTFGKPSRTSYHNKEWSQKMEEIGLMPSDTGEPGGARIGQQMADYVIDGGLFDIVFKRMPKSLGLPWLSTEVYARAVITLGGEVVTANNSDNEDEGGEEGQQQESLSGKKIKYSCPTKTCKLNVWGKPGINVVCGDCGRRLKVNNDRPKINKGRFLTTGRKT